MIRQLKALRATYADAGQWDRVYNVCAALTVLQAADKEELGFYERGAVAPLTLPGAALSEEIWQKVLYDPNEERRLSLLFSCVAPVVALARAQDPKLIGLKDRYRLDSGSDPSGVARLFEGGAGVLNVMPPAVYLNREFTGDVEILNLRDPAIATTTVMVGPNIVNGRVEKDVAFIIGPHAGPAAAGSPGAVAARRADRAGADGHRARRLQAVPAQRPRAQPWRCTART